MKGVARGASQARPGPPWSQSNHGFWSRFRVSFSVKELVGISCLVTLLANIRIVPEDGFVGSKGTLKNSSVTLSLPDLNQNADRVNGNISQRHIPQLIQLPVIEIEMADFAHLN
jgi:hypothetical protein